MDTSTKKRGQKETTELQALLDALQSTVDARLAALADRKAA